jgi:hypothetical protein
MVLKNTKASVHCKIITSFVFQVGFAGLSPSSQHLLLQLEAVYDLLQSLSASPASQASVTQYSEELSGQDMKATVQVVSQDVVDQTEAEDMPEDEKKEAAQQNNEAKSEATAPAPLPDLVTCHRALGAPVAIASDPSCHANEVNHRRLPDLVLSGLRRPPEERNLSAGRHAVIINTHADLSDDASDDAANTGELCLRPPVGRLSSHPVLPAALAAKTRRRHSFRIGHAAERHGAAGGIDMLRAGGHHPPLLRRAVVWRQAGAELAIIADSLMAGGGDGGSGGRLVVAVANHRQLAAANQRINSEEEEERMEDVMMDSWEGLLLAVMARAVLYACLSRLKRLLF